MINTILFGSRIIDYSIVYSERKTLSITVTPDIKVIVKAPEDAGVEKIRTKVRKKAAWIIKQQEYFWSFYPKTPPRKYVGGETHLYFGRQYLLKVTLSDRNEVKYKGRYIEVFTDDKSKARDLVKQWYQKRAKIKFKEIAEPLIKRFKYYNVEPTGLQVHDMALRWGSCTVNGKIILNPELMKAPKLCIEYVIIHELCHLIHHGHTRKFMETQDKEMPDWRKWKNKLERLLA